MRRAAIILLTLLWTTSAQAQPSSGPEGFGPIKFGMTEEEAWAALDGKGEWDGKQLVYELESPPSFLLPEGSLKVRQNFLDGRATSVGVSFSALMAIETQCYRTIMSFVTYIQAKYDTAPINPGALPKLYFLAESEYFGMFAFPMRNNSMVLVEGYYGREQGELVYQCQVLLIYHPPRASDTPF